MGTFYILMRLYKYEEIFINLTEYIMKKINYKNKLIKEVKTSQKRLNKNDIKFLLNVSFNILLDDKIILNKKDTKEIYKYIDNLINLNQ
jgi:ribosome-associated translation inhibitor RaiA